LFIGDAKRLQPHVGSACDRPHDPSFSREPFDDLMTTSPTMRLPTLLRAYTLALLALVASAASTAQTPPAYVLSSPLLPYLIQAPENGWVRVNASRFDSVWTPADLRPLDMGNNPTPFKILSAWSSVAWDPNRGDIIAYGGGHANYSGNDVYRWHSTTLSWERASLPSEIAYDPVSGFHAIDGVDNAPASAHTYDNNIYLPIADRFLTWGGGAYDTGGPYVRISETNANVARYTGPYLFDPSRADGNKVGGTTGSNVQRVTGTPIAGGQMWQNRDLPFWHPGQTLPGWHVNGCTGYAVENGKDVVYVAADPPSSTQTELFRYQLTTVTDPSLDQITKVGAYANSSGATQTCGYDTVHKVFLRTGTNVVPFWMWDVTQASPTNAEQPLQITSSIASFQSWLNGNGYDITKCAVEYDPSRGNFPLWCGGGVVWDVTPPAVNGAAGWSISQHPAPTTAVPSLDAQTWFALGKWRYAQYYDAFVTLDDWNAGNVWFYKPVGWHQPNVTGNQLPSVTLTSPATGTTVAPGVPIALTSSASDNDGSVVRVEYYVNGAKVGSATTPPYSVTINPILVGPYRIVAVAVDNVGGMAASAAANVTVTATLTTTVLQRGLNGYAGVSDTFLDAFAQTTSRGAYDPLYLDQNNYSPLVRFAIFASEGGPVPVGAVIQSATLELYKQTYDDTLTASPLLKPWVEAQATYLQAAAGVPWTVAGAKAPNVDVASTPDATVAAPYNAGWVPFDVTSRVRAWSAGGNNYGWRFAQTTAGYYPKLFEASENTATPTQRPRLTIVWSPGAGGGAPTVSITAPVAGATLPVGQPTTVSASASSGAGVNNVQFFANGTPIGTSTTPPYNVSWTPGTAGPATLTAVVTDNASATANSAPVSVTISAGTGTTVTLQRGLSGYAGASDTFLDSYYPTLSRGNYTPLWLDVAHYVPLVRFAIFQSEGGPVPDGAAIQSALLALYKQSYDDTLSATALLKPWVEAEATYNQASNGVPWSSPGARGAGTDYNGSADATIAPSANPGWVTFDVTHRVQQWSSSGANFGWRLAQVTTGYFGKTFYSDEYTTDTTLRPKLTIVYSGGSTNAPPTVSITSPVNGSSIQLGQSLTVSADPQDADGSVAKVQFFANGQSLGTVTQAPWSVPWTPTSAGTYSITAQATDNLGAATTSAPVSFSVRSTLVLQQGLAGYNGVTDTFLDGYLTTTVHGADTPLYVDLPHYVPLIRFAIFQSEGGPLPNGATVDSAVLSFYKQNYNDTLAVNALLRPWVESQATYNLSQTGVAWTSPGARGAGTDYNATTDATVAAPYAPGWISFDVTGRVRQWPSGGNYGWRMQQTTSGYFPKTFYSSEYTTDPTLRPKLTITYH